MDLGPVVKKVSYSDLTTDGLQSDMQQAFEQKLFSADLLRAFTDLIRAVTLAIPEFQLFISVVQALVIFYLRHSSYVPYSMS